MSRKQTQTRPQIRQQLDSDGFAIVPEVLDAGQIARLCEALEAAMAQQARLSRDQGRRPRPGLRNVTQRVSLVRELAQSATIRSLALDLLGPGAFAVRTLLFDKQPGANWNMRWHQDVAIAVEARADVPGFGPWSVKDGVPHVEPPVEVVKQMLALRVHLDDCDADNGALRVIAGSHARGRLRREQAMQQVEAEQPVVCECQQGDVLAMKPLLLHSSLPSDSPRHRRVIHIEFAGCELPAGLQWYERL